VNIIRGPVKIVKRFFRENTAKEFRGAARDLGGVKFYLP